MERNRESRRASIVGSNGFSSRRHRTNSLRDSPDEDGGIELQESVRLRDRVKKDRDRERDLRERTTRSKRRRGERETSEESTNDEDDEDEENTASVTGVRSSPAASVSNHHHDGHLSNHRTSHGSSISQQHIKNNIGNNHHLQHRKSFPLGSSSSKVFRAAPVWRPGDEIISVSVPRKARSASTKRSHDWMSNSTNNNSGGGAAAGAERNLRQASSSPARQGLASTSTPSSAPPAPMSPSSNPFSRKKLKPTGNNGGPKLKPPKASSKQSSSNPEELEIEIAEVLYGLMTQSQSPPSKKEDSKELDRSKSDSQIIGTSSNTLQSVAPKRKKPRQVVENSSHVGPVSAKPEKDQMPCGVEMGVNSIISQGQPVQPPEPTYRKQDSELETVAEEELRDSKDFVAKEERESSTVKIEDNFCKDSTLIETAATIIKANSMVSDMETQREQKFELDLMDRLPSRARSSPERAAAVDHKPVQSIPHASAAVAAAAEVKIKSKVEECESNKENENKGMNINLKSDLPKAERNGNIGVVNAGNKLHEQKEMPLKANKEEPLTADKSGQPRSSSLPMGSWIPPMGYMAAATTLQGVVSKEGSSVTPPPPVQPLFSQTRPKRCTTHCYIARNIHCLQQLMKMNPFLQAAASASASGSASLFASKPSNLNIMPTEIHTIKAPNNAHDKKNSPNNGVKDKSSQTTAAAAGTTSDSSQRKHQILVQQTLPHSNLLGPPFFLPFNQQQTAEAPPSSAKPNSAQETGRLASSNPVSSAMSFNYPNEAQYLAILQNNGYPFPVGPPPNYRGPTPALFNGSFYPTQMIYPSQIQHHQTQSNGVPASSQKQLLSQQQNNSGPANANVQNFQNEKKPQQQQQQQQPSHGFAMSFGPINGANGGIDIASMAQNHAIFQGFPEATRQMMAAAASASAQAAQKKNLKMSEDGKSRHNNGDSSAADDERKGSIAISSRSELANGPISSSSSSSRPVTTNQAQFQQLQQMAANFPNGFPQNLVQSSSQWKNSSQAPSTKNNNHPQQNSRPGTKLQNQISFGGNQKPSTPSHDHPMMASTNSKTGQNPSFSSQQSKNSQSILGNPKNMQQQAQLFFSSQFSQAQSPHSNTSSSNSGPTGFYMQRRRPDQQTQASTMTNDPAKAIAAAQFAAAGGTLLPAGFSYVQVKTAEQKQPAG